MKFKAKELGIKISIDVSALQNEEKLQMKPLVNVKNLKSYIIKFDEQRLQ